MRPFAGFFRSAGGDVKVGQCVFMNDGPTERNIDGQRFLKSGFVETDTTKFDTSIFTKNELFWTATNTGVDSQGLYVMAYNGTDRVCAGSAAGNIVTTTDGVTWSIRDGGFGSGGIIAMTYGNGLWVAGGLSGRIATSPDGLTWTQRTSGFGTSTIGALHQAGNIFLAVGEGGKMGWSTDGITWTVTTIPAFGSSAINSIWYDGTNYGWVAAGDDGKCAAAADPIVGPWTPLNLGFGTTSIRAIRSNGAGLWVACGHEGKIGVRTANNDWRIVDGGFALDWCYAIAAGQDRFVICANNGKVAVSRDGFTWTQLQVGLGAFNLRTVVFCFGTKWLIGGNVNRASLSQGLQPYAGSYLPALQGSAIQYMRIS